MLERLGEESVVELDRELEELVTQLAQEHPAFSRSVVERLVARTVVEFQDTPTSALLSVVRREVRVRLRYVEDLPTADRLDDR